MKKPFIIPVFIPHEGCPHQCVFCNQKAITGGPQENFSTSKINAYIERYLTYAGPRRGPAQIAFYGGNFLGLDRARMSALLEMAGSFIASGAVASLRFSTRPDTVRPETLDLPAAYALAAVELGAQSMDDRVLRQSRRGHTARDTRRAVALLRGRGVKTGIQTMVGLPGDTPEMAMETARQVVALAPDFVRIYPTLVVAESPLARWYQNGRYRPLSLNESVSLVKALYLCYQEHNIPVIRMGLQPSADLDKGTALVAGPYHPAFGHLVHSEIFLDRADSQMRARPGRRDQVDIKVHPRSVSRMGGLKNANIHALKRKYRLRSVTVIPDKGLAADQVIVL